MSSSPDELNLNRKPCAKSFEVIPAGESRSTHLTATTASKCASRSGDFEVLKLRPLRHQRAHKATQSKAQSCLGVSWFVRRPVLGGPANQFVSGNSENGDAYTGVALLAESFFSPSGADAR
jgi:hypothetical protein